MLHARVCHANLFVCMWVCKSKGASVYLVCMRPFFLAFRLKILPGSCLCEGNIVGWDMVGRDALQLHLRWRPLIRTTAFPQDFAGITHNACPFACIAR